jgi:hypothetical protein
MKTVQIKDAVAYANGKRAVAKHLNVVSIADNLFDHVVFKYTFLDENGLFAGDATYELKGLEQYQTWFATPEGAFEIVANGIGLEIVSIEGDKVAFTEVA